MEVFDGLVQRGVLFRASLVGDLDGGAADQCRDSGCGPVGPERRRQGCTSEDQGEDPEDEIPPTLPQPSSYPETFSSSHRLRLPERTIGVADSSQPPESDYRSPSRSVAVME